MKSRASTVFGMWTAFAFALMAVSGCGGETGQAASSVKLQGAGASFPAPLYNKWFKAYSGSHQNVLVDYQSVGSGSGVKSVVDHTVDFGASDAAIKPEDAAMGISSDMSFSVTGPNAKSIRLSFQARSDATKELCASESLWPRSSCAGSGCRLILICTN